MEEVWFIVFSIGLAQGLFLIFSLLSLKEKRKNPLRILVLLLFFYIILLVPAWLSYMLSYEKVTFLYRLGETIPLIIGPLFFLYSKSIASINFKLKRTDILHFLPFIFFLVIFMPFYFESTEFKLTYIKWRHNNIPVGVALFSWFKGLHSITYLLLSWFFIKKYLGLNKEKTKNTFNLKLFYLLLLFQSIMVSIVYINFTLQYFEIFTWLETDLIAALLITFSLYIYGFSILKSPQTIIPNNYSIRYARSSLNIHDKQKIYKKMTQLLANEKPYLKFDLTLDELSNMLDTTPNQLSQVINERLDKNFHQFINEYRVNEVKQNINDHKRTLYAIGLDSGFNSKSAFNRVFKDIAGMTPGAFKKSIKKLS